MPAVKLLFDECVGRPAMEVVEASYAGFEAREVQVAHILDFQVQGELDDVWVPRIAREGWIVISADTGSTPSRGNKLPKLCKAYGVTHILFSGSIHNSKQTHKIAALIHLADKLLDEAPQAPGGSEFIIRFNAAKNGYSLHLKHRANSDDAPKFQGDLGLS